MAPIVKATVPEVRAAVVVQCMARTRLRPRLTGPDRRRHFMFLSGLFRTPSCGVFHGSIARLLTFCRLWGACAGALAPKSHACWAFTSALPRRALLTVLRRWLHMDA